MTLRDDVSDIIGIRIPPEGYKKTFGELDRAGKITMRIVLEVILALIAHIEALENGRSTSFPQKDTAL